MIKAALTTLALASTGLFAHGGEPGDAVATVDGQAIEQRDFDHWMTIAAKSSGRRSFLPIPRPAIADASPQSAKRRPRRRRAGTGHRRALATTCKQDYAQLRDQVMQLLISFKWI